MNAAAVETREPAVAFMAWVGLGILLMISLVAFLDRQIISLMVGMIKDDLQISDGQIGLLQGAAFGLAYPLFAIPLGYASDRFSRRWVIFLGMIFWSLAATAGGFANSFTPLLAARIGVGIGEAALGPAAISLLGDSFPRHRLGLVMSIFSAGALLGSGIALAIGGAVIHWAGQGLTLPGLGHLAPWQVAFIVTGLPGAIIALLVFLVPEPPRKSGGQAGTVPWAELFAFMRRHARFLSCYILGFSSLQIATWASLAWLPAVIERSYGWSIVQVGATLAVFTIAIGLPGQIGNGMIVDRLFARGIQDAHLRYYAGVSLVAALCGVLAPLAPTAYLYLAILIPLKFAMNFGGVQAATVQIVTPSAMRGRMAAIMGTIAATIGGTSGPSVVALFTDHLFRDDAMVIWSLALTNAIFMPLAALLFWFGMKPMRTTVAELHAVR